MKYSFTSSCELCFNAEYYVTHEALKRTAELTEINESVLFPVSLDLPGRTSSQYCFKKPTFSEFRGH